VNVATFIIPLQDCRIVPFQPHASIPYGQGTVANESGHSTLPKFGHVRCILIIVCNKSHGTQPVLHSSVRLPLHHPSVLPLHNARVTRPQTACRRALGNLAWPPAIHPVCLAHCAAAVPTLTALRPKPTAKAVGYEPPLRSFRSTVTPKSQPHLQSAYQQPSASCRPNITSALGRYSDELPLMYGGGTFEIKSCSFWYPGMIHVQYRSYKWRTDALRTLYGRATNAYIPSTHPHRTKIVRFQMNCVHNISLVSVQIPIFGFVKPIYASIWVIKKKL